LSSSETLKSHNRGYGRDISSADCRDRRLNIDTTY
jgi:hypothetical protein